MHILLIQLRYKPARARRLLKLSNSKVKREVKKLFGALKVPNLLLLGEIDLSELGDRLISVRCRDKRTSSLYQDFERLKEALSDEGFAKIKAKKGIASIDVDERKCPEPPSSHPPEPSITLTDQTSLGSDHRHHDAMDGMQDGAKGPSDDSELAMASPLSAPCSPLYFPTTPYQPTTPEVEAMVLARTTSVETVTSPPHFPPPPSSSLSSPIYAPSSVYQTTPRARSSDAVVSPWMGELDDHDALKGLPPILSKRPSSAEAHNSGRTTGEPHPTVIPRNDAPSSFGQIHHPSPPVSLARDLSRLTIKKPRYDNKPADEGDSGKAERSVPDRRRRARSCPNDQPNQWKPTSPRSGSEFELRHGQVQDSDLSSSESLSPPPSRSMSSLQCDRDQEAPLVMTPNTDLLTRILVAYKEAKCQLDIANQKMTELEEVIVGAMAQRSTN